MRTTDSTTNVGEQVIEEMRHLTIAQLPAIPPGSIDMWPEPDPVAEHARRREAVAAALHRYEPSMVVTVELLDEIIAAAESGI